VKDRNASQWDSDLSAEVVVRQHCRHRPQTQPDKAKRNDSGDEPGGAAAASGRSANPSRAIGEDMTRMGWVRLWAEFAPGCLAGRRAVRLSAVPTRPR
jgi:hypothetical protein